MRAMRSTWNLVVIAGSIAGAAAQEPPAVASLVPAHLAVDVDATAVRQCVVTFDRDMDPAVRSVCGGGASFPKVVRTTWRDARTMVLDVELQPDQVYSMDLACAGTAGFRATDGMALPTTPWRFATAGPALAEGVAAEAANRLFGIVRDHYSYRDRLGIDWNQLERAHHDALAAAPSAAAFALHTMQVLASPQDPHISLRWMEATLPTYQRAVVSNFDLRSLHATFPKLERIGRIGLQARTDDGIGYLLVGSFAREQRADFELLLQALRGLRSCKALVLDVRTNGGGDENLARRLAGFFVTGEKVYAAHRVRDPRTESGFQDRQERSLRGNPDPDVFAGPVAVLMGPLNMSSCEAFLLMMKQAPQAILVGVNSYGSSGNPQPHTVLPGLVVLIPSWQALRPDGTCFEGEGIAPHIHVEATPAQLATADPVLAEALLRLRGKR